MSVDAANGSIPKINDPFAGQTRHFGRTPPGIKREAAKPAPAGGAGDAKKTVNQAPTGKTENIGTNNAQASDVQTLLQGLAQTLLQGLTQAPAPATGEGPSDTSMGLLDF